VTHTCVNNIPTNFNEEEKEGRQPVEIQDEQEIIREPRTQ